MDIYYKKKRVNEVGTDVPKENYSQYEQIYTCISMSCTDGRLNAY